MKHYMSCTFWLKVPFQKQLKRRKVDFLSFTVFLVVTYI